MDEARERIAEVYRNEGARMWRALFSFTGDREISSDALAEAFARALCDRATIRDPVPWTWRVAFRLATRELRERRGQASVPANESYEMPEPVPELMRALSQISPKQRLAVVLHDYADRSTADVAAVLGCSTATVHVHLSQGRRRLRGLLEDADG